MPKYTVTGGIHLAEDGNTYREGQTFESSVEDLDKLFVNKFKPADADAKVTKVKAGKVAGTDPDKDSDKSDNMTGDVTVQSPDGRVAEPENIDEELADLDAPKKGKKGAKAKPDAPKAKKGKKGAKADPEAAAEVTPEDTDAADPE